MSEVEWGPRMLRVLAWLCWVIAAMTVLTVLLTLVTEPPPWNRIQRLGDATAWWYVGALHMTLARRSDDRDSGEYALMDKYRGATVLTASSYTELADAERDLLLRNPTARIMWLAGGRPGGPIWCAMEVTATEETT